MTRETKIGLLMGLGFIVVFAVLLSHTTDFGRPPVGDNISIMAGHDDGAADLVGGVSGPAIVVGNPGPDTASSDFALAGSDVPELPEFPGMEAAETFEGVSGPSPDVPALAQRSEDDAA